MNRFQKVFSRLGPPPQTEEAGFWYRAALLDVRIAIMEDAPLNDFKSMLELHKALAERSNLCRN